MKIKQLDISKSWVTWAQIGFGVQVYALFHPSFAVPLGFVWGVGHGGERHRFEVMGSYTEVFYRRLGVRARINQEILKQFDIVSSPSASQSGKAFMLSQGYKFSTTLSQWHKTKEK